MTERLIGLSSEAPGLVAATLLLTIALIFATFRVLRGPAIPDRVIGLDLFASLIVGMLLLLGAILDLLALVDIGIVLALIAFLSTVAFASFIERRTRE